MNDAPFMEGLMQGQPRESWAYGEHRDSVYVDLHGPLYLSSCFKLHAWSSGHRFFSEEKDSLARRFSKTSEACMEFRRLATVFESQGDAAACRVELDAVWKLCKGMAAKALAEVQGACNSSSTAGAAAAVLMTSDASREAILLIRAGGGNNRAIVYMNVVQENTPNDSTTSLHVERVEPSILGGESLARAVLGKSAMWDMAPFLHDTLSQKIQEKMLAFLMYTHARLGQGCCPWLKDIDTGVFEGLLCNILREDSLEFGDVLAVIRAQSDADATAP